MSFEMSCANCEGRLMVETLGIVVACPHCGTHLSIPAEIPGLSDAPPKPAGSSPTETSDSETEDENNPDFSWAPAMAEEDLPNAFPDFSQASGSGVDKAASESNVLVSEPEIQTESEVPSAIRVANPDPSSVIPAIVTDAKVSEPISGFPVLDAPAPKTDDQETDPESTTGSEEQPVDETPALDLAASEEESSSEPVSFNLDSSEEVDEFPSFDLDDNDEDSETSPRVGTETTVEVDDFPVINLEGDSKGSEGLPTIDTGTTGQAERFPAVSGDDSPTPPPTLAEAVEETVGAFPVVQDAEETGFAPVISTESPKTDPQPTQESPKPATKPAEKSEDPKESVYDSVFNSRRGKIVPNAVFQAWFSYTIFVTLGLVFAIYYIFTDRERQLESLPDRQPLKQNERRYVPQEAAMPPGHTLELSETQRFGNIEVTPLKVTKSKLEIEDWDPEGPVLKLFVKFKNVSDDQIIVPLDEYLLFDQNRDRSSLEAGAAKSNQFLCKASEKRKKGNVVLVYARLNGLDFEFRNQNLGTALKPGEEVTIYIPSDTEGLNDLNGDLIWRVHFRKGYSPKKYGVTTVFEVKFNSQDIQA